MKKGIKFLLVMAMLAVLLCTTVFANSAEYFYVNFFISFLL